VERRLTREAIGGGDREDLDGGLDERERVSMGDRDALRLPRRAGGVEDVRERAVRHPCVGRGRALLRRDEHLEAARVPGQARRGRCTEDDALELRELARAFELGEHADAIGGRHDHARLDHGARSMAERAGGTAGSMGTYAAPRRRIP
jgi:hypothetical protein